MGWIEIDGKMVHTSVFNPPLKNIVLSVNSNPDYLFFLPLTCWAWQKFGWAPYVFYYGDRGPQFELACSLIKGPYSVRWDISEITGYRSDTITQVSRLYAASSKAGGYFMTGDIDMLPLSDYWKYDQDQMTVWGHDLTGYGHYPICYIGMNANNWRAVMKLENTDGSYIGDVGIPKAIKRDLDQLPQAKDPDFYKYWFTDQDLITQRLKPYNPTIINRGQYSNGYAVGRVDRGAWSLNHSQFIDCHMFQQLYHKGNQDKFDKTMELLTSIWPDEDFKWFIDYTNEFRQLTGHA